MRNELFTGCDMRTVYVAVITLFFIAFIVDTDAFYFIPVIIFAGNAVYAETISFSYLFHLRTKFFHRLAHISIDRRPILQCAVNNGRKFIAGHGTITFELTVRIAFQKTSVRQ